MPPDADEPGLRLGYACLNTLFESPARTTRLAKATPERLRELLAANLDMLEAILRWNDANDIQVFRVSSNTVPLASHPRASYPWREALGERFAELGDLMRRAGMRLSTHPGPYTVPASADEAIAAAAVRELDYHARAHERFRARPLAQDRAPSRRRSRRPRDWLDRFGRAFGRLAPEARCTPRPRERRALVASTDVLPVAGELNVPVVFDAFHHEVNGSLPKLGVRELVELAGETWREADGRQEVHFSTQAPGRRAGAHADTLDLRRFRRFAEQVDDLPLDCVLEVKDKEQSVLRARRTQLRLRQKAARPV